MTVTDLSEKEKYEMLRFIRDFCTEEITIQDIVCSRDCSLLRTPSTIQAESISDFIIDNFIKSFSWDNIDIIIKHKYYDDKKLFKALVKDRSYYYILNRGYIGYKGLNLITEMDYLVEHIHTSEIPNVIDTHGFITFNTLKTIGNNMDTSTVLEWINKSGRPPLKYNIKSIPKELYRIAYRIIDIPEKVLDGLTIINWDALSLYQDVPMKYLTSKLHLLKINLLLKNKYLSKEKKEFINKICLLIEV